MSSLKLSLLKMLPSLKMIMIPLLFLTIEILSESLTLMINFFLISTELRMRSVVLGMKEEVANYHFYFNSPSK